VPTYAEFDDLEERYPGALPTQPDPEILLGDASFWLSAWVPGLDVAITGGDAELAEAAKLLVVAMVKRALAAPGAENVQQETVGVFTVRYRNPEGNLYVYGRELDTILLLMTQDRAAAVSYRSPGL
jgi:DsbC/DsbD-like thiol-disulfide interchange protein